MKSQNLTIFLILSFSLSVSHAQNFELKNNTLNSGSETATSANFQLNGAVGEISSGPSTSANFILNAGSVSNRVGATVDPGLIAHYPFNGNLDDVSGNMFTVTFDGSQTYDNDVAGFPDKAFYFDGATRVVHTLDNTINFTGFTVSAWVYVDDPNASSSQHIIGLESSDRLFQVVTYNGNFAFWEGNDLGNGLGLVELFGGETVGWHHVVVTWNGTIVTGYVDAVALNYGDAPEALDFTVEEFSLGNNNHFDEYLSGSIDEVKIFDYALPFEEVQNLYNSYPPTPTPPLNLVAKVVGPQAIQLTWDDGNNETFYEVYWEDPEGESGNIDLGQDETSYTITGLNTDIEYYIEVIAWNDYDKSSYTAVYQTPVNKGPTQAQAFPKYFTLDEEVTIQFYPQLSYPVGDLEEASKVYMYAGLITPENVESGDWSNTIGNWGVDDGVGEMVLSGGVWEITITPRDYFLVSDDFIAAQMAMVFTNEEGTLIGKAANLEDIKLDVFDPTNIGPIGGFLATDANTDVYLDDAGAFTPDSIQLENMTEFTMEALVNFNDTDPAIQGFVGLITRGFDDGTSYTPYHGIVEYTNPDPLSFPTSLIITEESGSEYNYFGDFAIDYANNTWSHVALVFSTSGYGTLEVYINGIYQGFLDIFEAPKIANMLRIGQFEGGVDELRFWNDVRTQEQIRENIKTEINPASEGLIGYWKMNATTNVSGTDYIIDETTSLNDLIVENGTITQLPDLDVISFALNPKSIAQEETLSISYTIENIGAADASAFDLDFYWSTDVVFDGSDVAFANSNVNFPSGAAIGESFFDVLQVPIPDAATIPDGDYFVIAVIDGSGSLSEGNKNNNTAAAALNVATANVNNVTTSITLDDYSFPENAATGTVVGAISYDDPDEDLFDISLVAGTGDTDNALFQIVGGELLVDAFLDFEIDKTSYEVRIQVDDNRGGIYEEPITLSLTDVNEAPTDISLTNATIAAGASYFESLVGTLETTDQDNPDSHSYIITVEDNPDASFLISGSDLLITVNDPILDEEYFITIQSTDSEGLTTSKELVVTVVPAAAAPTGLLLSNNTINESHGAGAAIGKFFTTDDDSDTHTYSFAGGADDGSFGLTASGELTQEAELAEGSYSIRVTTTDEADLSLSRTFEIIVRSNSIGGSILSVGGDVKNYRLIGVPFTSTSVSNIFGDLTNEGKGSEWRILSFNNGSISDLSLSSNLTGGNGYWFISTKSVTVQLPAANLNTNATVSKSLSAGWNAVGNPFLNALNWNTVKTFNEGLGTISSGDVGDIFTWNGSWNTTPQLEVMQGGYVKATNASAGFAIPASTASVGSARVAASSRMSTSYLENSSEWQLMFLLESKGISSNISGVGVNPSSIEGIDALDIDPPPTPSVFDPLQLTEKATGLTKNLKEISKSVIWDFTLTGTSEETTLSWNQSIASQLDEPLMIALLPQGELFDMSEMGSITFNPEKNQSVMVIYGDELPKELLYNAITAYPNPANQEVSFRFYVDGEGTIPASVELYNLGGQRLGAINQNVNGGHWAEIQYQIGSEDILKSGIYLFKVRYNDFESVVKKLIVK